MLALLTGGGLALAIACGTVWAMKSLYWLPPHPIVTMVLGVMIFVLLMWILCARYRAYFGTRVVAVTPDGLFWKASFLPARLIPWNQIASARLYPLSNKVDIKVGPLVTFSVGGVFADRQEAEQFQRAVNARIGASCHGQDKAPQRSTGDESQ